MLLKPSTSWAADSIIRSLLKPDNRQFNSRIKFRKSRHRGTLVALFKLKLERRIVLMLPFSPVTNHWPVMKNYLSPHLTKRQGLYSLGRTVSKCRTIKDSKTLQYTKTTIKSRHLEDLRDGLSRAATFLRLNRILADLSLGLLRAPKRKWIRTPTHPK
jgi:hypothetical protein